MRGLFACGAALLLAGAACGSPGPPAGRSGEQIYRQYCYACHALEAGRNTAAGPTLHNIVGRGVAAEALMDGSADIAHETQNLRVVVVPEISGATASLLATAINPAFGLGTYLAQLALRKPLTAAATQEFEIAGTWSDPQIKKVPRRPELDVKPGQAAAPAAAPTPAPDAAPQPLEPKPEKTR